MKSFRKIQTRAATRKGGEAALQSLLPTATTGKRLSQLDDARALATMTQCVFQAGFAWKVIRQKWPGFEAAFFGFNPQALELLSPEQLDALAQDTRIVRNPQKIHTVPRNAQWIVEIANQHGCFGAFLAQWPCDDLVGLFQVFKKRGARLGGQTGQRVIRLLGKDTFVLSNDVVHALRDAGLDIPAHPSSQRALRAIQKAFNQWHEETGLPYAHLSKILAYSVGDNHPPEVIRQEMALHEPT